MVAFEAQLEGRDYRLAESPVWLILKKSRAPPAHRGWAPSPPSFPLGSCRFSRVTKEGREAGRGDAFLLPPTGPFRPFISQRGIGCRNGPRNRNGKEESQKCLAASWAKHFRHKRLHLDGWEGMCVFSAKCRPRFFVGGGFYRRQSV